MIGYEIDFINAEHDENHVIDQEGPFFENSPPDFVKKCLLETLKFLDDYKEHGQVRICKGGYLGNESEGYDFNEPYSSRICKSPFDVESYFRINRIPLGIVDNKPTLKIIFNRLKKAVHESKHPEE